MAINIYQATDPGGGARTITLYKSTGTPAAPSQLVTVLYYTASNATFQRSVQVSNEYVFVRKGTYSAAFPLAAIVTAAVDINTNLTWNPVVGTQPTSGSCIVGGSPNHVDFAVVATAELAISYQWKVDTGGGYANVSNGGIYSGATSATLTVTPSDITPNGYKYKCTLTIGNAVGGYLTTDTNEVTLTVAAA